MKKTFLSLLLALSLTLSLAVPALAYEGENTDPEWVAWKTQWLAAHPEEAAAFDADAYFENEYLSDWWYSSKEEFMSDWGLETEQDFCDFMRDDWLAGMQADEARQSWMDQYESAHPGALSAFDPDAWFQAHYYEDPKQAFMAEWGLETQDAFRDFMLNDYVDTLIAQEERQAMLDEFEAAHPGVIAAFDADAYFEENYSWWSGGKEDYMRWMDLAAEEDFRQAMLDDMIYSMSWSQSWEDTRNEEILAMGGVPGQLGVMVDGTYLSFPQDKPPYAVDGVTYVYADALNAAIGSSASGGADGYVPLRDAAVAAGYEVFWDDAYQTVVLLDRAGFIAETDARFTVLNRALAAWAPEDGKNYQSAVDITAGYTKFNSLDGDQTWTMSAALTALSGAAGVELSGSYDLSSLMDILKAANPSLTQSTDDALPGQYSALLKGDFGARLDQENEMLYLRMSLFSSLFSILGKPYPKDVWISQSLEGYLDLSPDVTPTVGGYLYLLSGPDANGYSYARSYQYLTEAADTLAALVGDDRFVQKGRDSVLTLSKEDLGDLLAESGSYSTAEDIREFALTLTVKADGTVTGSLVYRPEPYSAYSTEGRITAGWSLALSGSEIELEYHVKNEGVLRLTVTASTKTTSAAPAVTPPEGAAVLPAEDLWNLE